MTTTVSHLIDESADRHRRQAEFRDALISAGLLVPTSVTGLYLRSEQFESIVRGIDMLVSGVATADQSLHAPLLMPRELLERTGYPRSFPDLTGVVSAVLDPARDHAKLLAAFDGGEDEGTGSAWTSMLEPTDLGLCSAACHPIYPAQAGTVPDPGRVVEVFGQCFRREPSIDPARMQTFRQHEFVYLGDAAGAQAHRELWLQRALEIHDRLRLQVVAAEANDPFFGRAGQLLAANQRQAQLKIEILAPIASVELPTAITSANLHLDRFGAEFAIRTADGAAAHTACIGFGVERTALALLRAHGFDISAWPAPVREALGW